MNEIFTNILFIVLVFGPAFSLMWFSISIQLLIKTLACDNDPHKRKKRLKMVLISGIVWAVTWALSFIIAFLICE